MCTPNALICLGYEYSGSTASMLAPPPGSDSPEFGILRTFANEQERDAFYASALFKAWEEQSRPLTEGEWVSRPLHGLEAWFRAPQHPPARWKMAVLTWLAVWPVSMAVRAVLHPFLGTTVPSVMFAGVVAGGIVVVLTWGAMPVLVKVAHRWLQPPPQPSSSLS